MKHSAFHDRILLNARVATCLTRPSGPGNIDPITGLGSTGSTGFG
jgi:hypothetical protein